MKILLTIHLLAFLFSCGDRDTLVDKSKLLGNDYRLFQETPVWNLAKAVEDEKADEIKRIVIEEKANKDFQEERFGSTLLMLSIINHHYISCKTLLELGADVHKHEFSTGRSAIMYAADLGLEEGDNTRFLRLLLQHGANPNDEEIGKRGEGNSTRKTPLLLACDYTFQSNSAIEKVKLLVEAGANINYSNEYNETPIRTALTMDHFDILLYLLEKGADFNTPIHDAFGSYKLEEELRYHLYPIDSKEYKQKMAVVDFLLQHGIDYRKTSIPENIRDKIKKQYPNNWKEYLEKY